MSTPKQTPTYGITSECLLPRLPMHDDFITVAHYLNSGSHRGRCSRNTLSYAINKYYREKQNYNAGALAFLLHRIQQLSKEPRQ